jgi:hypothetical protein
MDEGFRRLALAERGLVHSLRLLCWCYRQEYAEQAGTLALFGLIDEQLAKAFGVSRRTVQNWQQTHPKFAQAIARGKQVADDAVERSLFHRARGYSHQAVKLFFDARRGEVVRAEYLERFPPDPTSMIYWLKNRRPDRWRDHRDETPADPSEIAKATRDLVLALFRVDPHPRS